MQSDDLGLVERLREPPKYKVVGHLPRSGIPEVEIDLAALSSERAEAAAAIERLVAERDEAREALKPFADLANDYMTGTVNIEDDVIIAGRMTRRGEEGTPPRVTFGDFRRAHLVDKIGRARQALGEP